jgi:hypothetical protein
MLKSPNGQPSMGEVIVADDNVGQASPERSRSWGTKTLAVAVTVLLIYCGSLLAYHLLAQTSRSLPAPDLGGTSDTIVVVNLESLDTVNNQLKIKVLVVPDEALMDTKLDVLNTDIAVGLYPANEIGDLVYLAGRKPPLLSTVVAAKGDSHNWPFDAYTTPALSASLLTGEGADRQALPARVEVSGSLEGWDVSTSRSGDATQSDDGRGDDVTITIRRAKGPLVFDLGICLVLISMPVLGVFVVTSIMRGKKELQPAFVGWLATMLFAAVPIRNILPGSPPYGSWIDQAVVLWVLIALVVSMILFVVHWYRTPD